MVRFKNRYLLVEMRWEPRYTDEKTAKDELFKAIKDSIEDNFGDFGIAMLIPTLRIKFFNLSSNLLLLKAPRSHFDLLWTSLTCLTSISGVETSMNVIHVSGTIKSSQKVAIQHQKEYLKVTDSMIQQEWIEAMEISDDE